MLATPIDLIAERDLLIGVDLIGVDGLISNHGGGLISSSGDRLISEDGRIADVAPRPPRTLLARVTTMAKVVVGALAAYLLLTHLGQIAAAAGAFARSNPFWMSAALAFAGLNYVLAAWTLGAATRIRLPLGRTVAAQLAAASANRLSPAGLGGMGLNVRDLEASGSTRSAALGAVGLGQVSSFVARLALIVGLAAATDQALPLQIPLRPGWPLILVLTAVVGLGAAALWRWRLLHRLVAGIASAVDHIRDVASEPRRLAVLLIGSAGTGVVHAGALAACIAAVGGHLGPTDALFIYLTGSAMSAAVPSPGGVGAVEASLIAGLVHLGLPGGIAFAGVISYRLVTYWLPIVPGLVCAAFLRRRQAI
ncbi:MAG: lysylphosphatidylglycerol synthase transmembrane domain-containing protein [Acidimicrobiales bacterium]